MKKIIPLLIALLLLLSSCSGPFSLRDIYKPSSLKNRKPQDVIEALSNVGSIISEVDGAKTFSIDHLALYGYQLETASILFNGNSIDSLEYKTVPIKHEDSDQDVELINSFLKIQKEISDSLEQKAKIDNDGDEIDFTEIYPHQKQANDAMKLIITLKAIAGETVLTATWENNSFSLVLNFDEARFIYRYSRGGDS